MENQSNPSRFFGLPSSWRIWARMGRRFWAGVLMGIGLGLLLSAVLVEQKLMTANSKAWVSVAGIILTFLGQSIAWDAVNGGQVEGTPGRAMLR
jgi:hypothetical protein